MTRYRIDNLVHSYGDRPVLAIDRWSVEPNSITGLCGPNGSGKSTLLKLLGFIERPSRGTIRFNGKAAGPSNAEVRRNIALLPQSAYLLRRSVYKNVAYGLRVRNKRNEEAEQVRQALCWVGLDPDRFAQRPWYALSGGEAQRVALAARLALTPQVLLLDEPTTSVDAASAQRIKEAALNAHRQWGTSIIVASHDMGWLQEICHDMVYLFQGKLLTGGQRTPVFGPWHSMENGRAFRELSDGQRFIAATMPANPAEDVAIISPSCLKLYDNVSSFPQDRVPLEGIVTTLRMDKTSGKISASIMVDQIEFFVFVPENGRPAGGFQPGDKVRVGYRPEDVQWF